ncbi:integral membrane protein GPR155 [Chanos chanos]|uniref:Integral membrane protein GPR155 n=1 Tax=Chanos chanos TaxID=29144 RepID=A0A6J2WF30_CHACN|nr:integral membrane protein GPR155 [Chanos chanos]XP_030641982.1 integral membrane protein GPR155 [Chanos chanos]
MDVLSSNISNGNVTQTHPVMSIDKLFPALLECFGIILCGYVAGRAGIITSTQAKGLGNFVSKFALPALLFKSMVELDLNNVIWSFLWSILIAKTAVFFIVGVVTLLVTGRESRFSKAGLFSIFATQSNDFALGYPIAEALYRNYHPEYLQYIYLVAPVSLMVLNPVGFAFCEIQKWQSNQERQQSKFQIVGVAFLQVLKNPIVFMVIIGIVMHFLLGQKIPGFMEEFVNGLANSFGGAALFYLGLSMVGQLRKLTRSAGVALILLITAKLLMLPLMCRGMVEFLNTGNGSSLDHSSLSNYAFLYGVFPTAPSVAIYAAHYGMEIEVVTSGMVICTFVSAPIMYVSAWLLTISWMDPKPLATALQNVCFNISIICLIALVWTVAVMLLSKKFRRLPHLLSVNLFVAQLMVCIGMIIWNFVVEQDNFIGQVLTFLLLYSSLYSTYVWPGLIALSLVFLKRERELSLSPRLLAIIGWGLPLLAMAILLISGSKMPDTIDSAFFYGRLQIICSAVVLIGSIIVGGVSLMILSRGTQSYQNLDQGSLSGTTEDVSAQSSPVTQTSPGPGAQYESINGDCYRCSPAQTIPDRVDTTQMNGSLCTQTGPCGLGCDVTHCLLAQEEQRSQDSDIQQARHVLLCLLLTISMLANFASCVWWLVSEVPGRLYVELQFFCAVANYGQGLISFSLFGLDKHLIILPFKKRLTRLWQALCLREEHTETLTEEIRLTCSQFIHYHKDQCVQDIVQKKRCGESSLVQTFLGSDMVAWLQRVGLAQDQGEALRYGSRLLEGGVIRPITQDYGFQDDCLHYCFIEEDTNHQ